MSEDETYTHEYVFGDGYSPGLVSHATFAGRKETEEKIVSLLRFIADEIAKSGVDSVARSLGVPRRKGLTHIGPLVEAELERLRRKDEE